MNGKEKICPLMSVGRFSAAPCAGKSCAWMDPITGTCFISVGADCLRETQNQLNVMNMILGGDLEEDEDPAEDQDQ